MRTSKTALALLLYATLSAETASAKEETGRWRLPSNLAQWCGVGYGPGYHAPIVRSPGSPTLEVPQLAFVPKECGPFGCSDFRPAYLGPATAPKACGFGMPCGHEWGSSAGVRPAQTKTYLPTARGSVGSQPGLKPSTSPASANHAPSSDNLWWR